MIAEEAIKTAINYETKIRDIYLEGAEAVGDDAGRRFFKAMGSDEQSHLDYLNQLLVQLQKTGKLSAARLESAIPSREEIEREADVIQSQMAQDDHGLKQQMLSKALKVEIETSAFYRKMVADMPAEGKPIFARFLEIEDNHIHAVQFELDYIAKTGYWFNFKEFDME